MSRTTPRTRSLVPGVGLLGAVVVIALVGGGSAVAGSLVTSAQIKDHTIEVRDLAPKTVEALHGQAGPRGVAGARGPQGVAGEQGRQGEKGDQGTQGIQGIQGIQGVQGVQGEQGPAGTARGYAVIRSTGAIASQGGDFSGLVVTHPSTGTYCLSGTGTGLSSSFVPLVVTLHGPDRTVGSVSVNDEYGTVCDAAVEVFTTNGAGTATDQYFAVVEP